MCVHARVRECSLACMQRVEARPQLGVYLYHYLSTLFSETGFLTEPGAHQLARLSGQQVPGSSHPHSPSTRHSLPPGLAFHVNAGIKTQLHVFMCHQPGLTDRSGPQRERASTHHHQPHLTDRSGPQKVSGFSSYFGHRGDFD